MAGHPQRRGGSGRPQAGRDGAPRASSPTQAMGHLCCSWHQGRRPPCLSLSAPAFDNNKALLRKPL
jgi:hypothetical protein